MSKPRYGWWGYAISMIRRYPERVKRPAPDSTVEGRERAAVTRAIEQTMKLPDGDSRMIVIDLMYWRNTHKLYGASRVAHVSERTAQRWHADFIRTVGRNFGLMDS